MDGLPPFTDNTTYGEWLHGEVIRRHRVVTNAQLLVRVESLQAALQALRLPASRLQVVVVEIDRMGAFTGPGRYLYLTRGLLSHVKSDPGIAHVIAHEMAHHDLGHVDLFGERYASLRQLPHGDVFLFLLKQITMRAFSLENEMAADAYGLDLCLQTGYNGRECLSAFNILETELLKARRTDMVYGPDTDRALADDPIGQWMAKAQSWRWRKVSGYPPVRERKALLLAQLGEPDPTYPLVRPDWLREIDATRGSPHITAEMIDTALDAWQEKLRIAVGNIRELTRREVFRRLERAGTASYLPLAGETRTQAIPALANVRDLLARIAQLKAIFDQATLLRRTAAEIFDPPDMLREIEALLVGPSIERYAAPTPLSEKSLCSPPARVERFTPDAFIAAMQPDFERAKSALLTIEAAWERHAAVLVAVESRADALQRMAELLGHPGEENLEAVRQEIAGLRTLIETDPLGATTTAREQRIDVLLNPVHSRLKERSQRREQVRNDLERARRFLQERQASQEISQAGRGELMPLSRPEATSDRPPLDPTALPELASWLEVLERTWTEGRWTAVEVGLRRWQETAVVFRKEESPPGAPNLPTTLER